MSSANDLTSIATSPFSSMASAPSSYTATAMSDDDPLLDIGNLFINDDLSIIDSDNEDDDDLSLDGLEENDANPPPPYYTGTLCVVCRKRPRYSRRGKSYPTCGFTCAARLDSSPSQRGPYHGRGGSTSSRGGSPSTRRTLGAASSTLPLDQNPPASNLNPVFEHLFQHLGDNKQQSTLDSVDNDRYTSTQASEPAPPTILCVICLAKPCYSSEYVTCGLGCAETLCKKGSNPYNCNYCHRQPKLQGQNQCSQACINAAKVACLLCKSRPRLGRYHLCGKTCKQIAVKSTPLILEALPGHATYELVEQKFKSAWKVTTTQCPPIKKIFKIIENGSFLLPYDRYKKRVGHEVFRYHGTARHCTLGNGGNTQLCTSTTCPLCSILRTSFKVSLAKSSGAFGAGVYTSSASNKSYSYTRSGTGAVILTKVVLGKVRNVAAWNEVMNCPVGFDSVVFDRQNGTLNETIVYSDDAIRPVFLLLF